ncbi:MULTISPECIES: 2-hydroxyacid dehydrogenase [unclassified Microbacterium]|uniref:2-hydroxyacid dehydrogenase n=1 Tax=unclassified Microbacterium TaxID=2609290 RepID=UPI00364C13C2
MNDRASDLFDRLVIQSCARCRRDGHVSHVTPVCATVSEKFARTVDARSFKHNNLIIRESIEEKLLHVIVADPMQVRLAEELRAALGEGVSWEFLDRPEHIAHASMDAEVFVGSRMDADQIRQRSKLRLIQVAGAGYEGIELSAVPRDVVVANTSHHGRAIAEYCLMSMLALSRNLLVEDGALREGTWLSVFQDPTALVHDTLVGKTVGIIGYGEIGSHIGRLARAIGMRVASVRRNPQSTAADELDWVGSPDQLPYLLRTSDFVIVTVPLTESTVGLIGEKELALMPRNSVLINVARGPIVDEEALYAALHEKRIRGAAIDVWWRYPAEGNRADPSKLPFGALRNVLVTPHTSGVTTDVFHNRMKDVAANIAALRDGLPLRNVVVPAR